MVDIQTVLYHIAEELRQYTGGDKDAAIEEFVLGCTFSIHLAITTDVEESEWDFMERYGKGHTFYFRLINYQHGKHLASEMYWVFLGKRPSMDNYTGDRFDPSEKLYLFIHVGNINPPPAISETTLIRETLSNQ